MKIPSILDILQNETYAGDKRLQKKPPMNFHTKRSFMKIILKLLCLHEFPA